MVLRWRREDLSEQQPEQLAEKPPERVSILDKYQKSAPAAAQSIPADEPASATVEQPLDSDSDRYYRPMLILLAFGLFCGLGLSLWNSIKAQLDVPIRQIKVLGEVQHLDKTALAARLAEQVEGPLLSADIEAFRQRVTEEPWVNRSWVKRAWPAALEVEIQEQVAVARWGDKGLLNPQGDIFWPPIKAQHQALPKLQGPASETARVMAQYHDLSQFFQGAQTKLVGLTLEPRGAWTLTLDNDIQVVLGREQLRDRLRRFLRLYQRELVDKAALIERVDIRYTNGAAVKWRPQIETPAPEPQA